MPQPQFKSSIYSKPVDISQQRQTATPHLLPKWGSETPGKCSNGDNRSTEHQVFSYNTLISFLKGFILDFQISKK